MLNVFPQVTGIFVARHLKISYSAAVDLAWLAFWDNLRLRREVSTQPENADLRCIALRGWGGGLSIRLDRLHDCIEVRILRDGRAPSVVQGLRDMREVLDTVRDTVENYRRPRRAWWAVVPTDQYRSIQFQ